MGATSMSATNRLRDVARRRLRFSGTPSAVRRTSSAAMDMGVASPVAQKPKKRGDGVHQRAPPRSIVATSRARC